MLLLTEFFLFSELIASKIRNERIILELIGERRERRSDYYTAGNFRSVFFRIFRILHRTGILHQHAVACSGLLISSSFAFRVQVLHLPLAAYCNKEFRSRRPVGVSGVAFSIRSPFKGGSVG